MFKKPYTQACVIEDITEITRFKQKVQQDPNLRLVEPLGNSPTFAAKPKWIEYSPTIWVVSPGGSGSSLLYDNMSPSCPYASIKSHSHHFKWKGKNCIMSAEGGGYMWEIEENDKIIYLYAHPLNVLLSFYKKIELGPHSWTEGDHHYIELLCNTNEPFMETYLYKDVLNLERHLDCWWRTRDFDILCIKYEHLHEHIDNIKTFIEGGRAYEREINFKLPPKRKRSTNWKAHPQKELLLKTYASVIEKYEQKPDYELFIGDPLYKNVF